MDTLRCYVTINPASYELQCIDSMQHFRSKIVIFAKMLSNALEIKIKNAEEEFFLWITSAALRFFGLVTQCIYEQTREQTSKDFLF